MVFIFSALRLTAYPSSRVAMQFKKGAVVPHWGVLYRVESVDLINGHVCYRLADPTGVTTPVAHAQHTEIVAEIEKMARYVVWDRFSIPGVFGHRWVKARKWDGKQGCILYRLDHWIEESRTAHWMSQTELDKATVVGFGYDEAIRPALMAAARGTQTGG